MVVPAKLRNNHGFKPRTQNILLYLPWKTHKTDVRMPLPTLNREEAASESSLSYLCIFHSFFYSTGVRKLIALSHAESRSHVFGQKACFDSQTMKQTAFHSTLTAKSIDGRQSPLIPTDFQTPTHPPPPSPYPCYIY